MKMKRKTKILIQKLMGLCLIGFCLVLIFTDISYDPVTQCKDGTPIMIFAPLGLYMMFTSELILTI